MLLARDLQLLCGWCRRHGVSWLPGRAEDGADALLLLPARGGPELLLTGAPELQLLDGQGSVLASASDLPALLDALEAGMRPARSDSVRLATLQSAEDASP